MIKGTTTATTKSQNPDLTQTQKWYNTCVNTIYVLPLGSCVAAQHERLLEKSA